MHRLAAAVALALAALISSAQAADQVRIGIARTMSDSGYYIADALGFFRDEGIEVSLIDFKSAAQMIAPLGSGELDVGGGTVSAGLYNAVARGIDLKVVADQASMKPGYGYSSLMVRKDMSWCFTHHPVRPLSGHELTVMRNGGGIHVNLIPGTFRPVVNMDNDYMIDRVAQKQHKSYCGVKGIAMQDAAVQESMGPIQDRTKENLVSTDNGVIMSRIRLRKDALAVQKGETPDGLDPATHAVRSAAIVLPADASFYEAAGDALKAKDRVAHMSVMGCVIARRAQPAEAISAADTCASEERLLRGVYPWARRRRDPGARNAAPKQLTCQPKRLVPFAARTCHLQFSQLVLVAARIAGCYLGRMGNINPNPFTTRPEIEGTFGVVTSTHWIATAVGMSMLEKGGNAFDAACATAFTLQVVEPHLNGPGGDVPVILYDTRKGRPEVICGQGPAPAGATIAHFQELGLDMIPGTGLLAACVPGMFDTWMLLLRDYGTLHLEDVLGPAIFYAREGHPLVERANATIRTVEKLFRDHWPTSAAVYLPGGKVPEIGTLFTNRAIADTYARVLREAESVGGDRVAQIEHARKTWSQGFVAEAIDRFCRTQAILDTSGERHRGVLSGDDMARWQATVEAPLTYDYGRYTVCKAGVWSQGPVLLQQLALLKGFDLDGLDVVGPEFIHTVVECSKLAYADREKFYGDPSFTRIPIETLLSDAYNDARRELIGASASHDLLPGSVEGFGAVVKLRRADGAREAVGAMGAGEPTVGRLGEVVGDTVHFDIIDRAGNMISSTPSGGWLQSSPVIPELGFGLGTRGQMFWLEEGHPAALAPGKRPRTTLSPTLALRDGDPYLAWGSPGGDQQDQWTTQFFLRHVHANLNLQEAIDAPAWHSEHFPISFWPRTARPGVLVVESRVPKATRDELERRGHVVEVGPAWSEGRLTAASRVGRRRRAAANPRGMQGYAAGR